MPENIMTKRRFTATKHERQESQRHVYFQFAPDGDERREGVYMTRKHFDLMGQPDVITVTLEPGNHIAEEEYERTATEIELNKIPTRMPEVPLTFGQG